ncbi:MAG: hypothetical protein EXR66_02210 [Dehalococcoidia bacterium]|nr:hypothetical protein [Dehalococcoidia bacterium]
MDGGSELPPDLEEAIRRAYRELTAATRNLHAPVAVRRGSQ